MTKEKFEFIIKTELSNDFFRKYKKEIKDFNLLKREILNIAENSSFEDLHSSNDKYITGDYDNFVLRLCCAIKYIYKPSSSYLKWLFKYLELFINDKGILKILLTHDPAENKGASAHCSFCQALCYDCNHFGNYPETSYIHSGCVYDRTKRFTSLIPYLYSTRQKEYYNRSVKLVRKIIKEFPTESLVLFIALYNFSKKHDKRLFKSLEEHFNTIKDLGYLEMDFNKVLGVSNHDAKDKNPFEDKDRRLITLFDLD